MLAVAGPGCGAVEFIPSPFTPQKVDLIYSTQEDISIVRWRISSTAPGSDLQFQFLGDDGYQTIDFSQSIYPGGGAPCGDGQGTCYQYVVRGQYPAASRPRPVQGVHATYGVLPGELAHPSTVATTLSLTSFFHTNNDQVYVDVTDQVAADGPYAFPRSYQHAMWPTAGLCVAGAPPPGTPFAALDATGGFAPVLPLTQEGSYCVGLQPVPADAGGAALAQTRVETVPVFADLTQTYSPPVEQSPIIYLIVLDLDIPIADRCTSALSTIEQTVDQAMNAANVAVPVEKLGTLNLAMDTGGDGAPGCSQSGSETVPAADIAQEVFQKISAYPQVHQQVHVLYFNNLDAPLATTLVASLNDLFSDLQFAPPPYQLETISWIFNPDLGALPQNGVSWTRGPGQPWKAADDPSFPPMLATYVMDNLPYESQTHDYDVPVPLLSAAQAAQDDGGQIKICDSTKVVTPAYADSDPLVTFPGALSWPVVAATPPGYLVALAPQIDVPYSQFVAETVNVDYQVCTAYCDGHPYVSQAGTGASSWSQSYLCAEGD